MDYEVAYIGKCDLDVTAAVDLYVSRHIPYCTTMSKFMTQMVHRQFLFDAFDWGHIDFGLL